MAKELEKVDAVIVGTGWAGGIAAAELTKKTTRWSLWKEARNKQKMISSARKMS